MKGTETMDFSVTSHALADVRNALQSKAVVRRNTRAAAEANKQLGQRLLALRNVLRTECGCANNRCADGLAPKGWDQFLRDNLPSLQPRRAREYVAMVCAPQPKAEEEATADA